MKEYIWEFSASNSWIRFKVAYMQIGQISGTFLRFHGTVVSDDLFTHPAVSLVIEIKSVETLNPLCNETMLSDSFLAAADYPHIIYSSVGAAGKVWGKYGSSPAT
jgi:polyisoprenoid-binding protein YceI